MRFIIKRKITAKDEALILGMFEEDKNISYQELDKEVQEAIKEKLFSKKFAETYSTKMGRHRIVVLGMGKKKELTIEKYRRLLGKALRAVKGWKQQSFFTDLPELVRGKFENNLLSQATAEALILSNYSFDRYLSAERKREQRTVTAVNLLWKRSVVSLEKGLKIGRIIAESTNFSRDLVNESASVVNSVYLENMAKIIAAHSKIELKVLNESQLRKLGMNALLGVNAGSENPPKLVFLEYHGGKAKDKFTAFVGKGITFDSGGYNLKPTKYIEEMKIDMGGAAAVIGTIKAAAQLGIKKNIVGVMALCENMISSKAQRPGDIVKSYSGQTIEIGNTDAEGRLILADALTYTEQKYKPEIIIDLATLTGACVVALGYYAAGAVSKEKELLQTLQNAGEKSGDRVWGLPFYDEYQDWMNGSITDLSNLARKGKGYEAGTITAGVFLSKFVKKAKWAHLDIAGSAYWEVDGDYLQKGATGSGVRVLSYYLLGN